MSSYACTKRIKIQISRSLATPANFFFGLRVAYHTVNVIVRWSSSELSFGNYIETNTNSSEVIIFSLVVKDGVCANVEDHYCTRKR